MAELSRRDFGDVSETLGVQIERDFKAGAISLRYEKYVKVILGRFGMSLKKNQNTPRPSEHPPVMGEKMSKRLGGIKGCKYKPLHGI